MNPLRKPWLENGSFYLAWNCLTQQQSTAEARRVWVLSPQEPRRTMPVWQLRCSLTWFWQLHQATKINIIFYILLWSAGWIFQSTLSWNYC